MRQALAGRKRRGDIGCFANGSRKLGNASPKTSSHKPSHPANGRRYLLFDDARPEMVLAGGRIWEGKPDLLSLWERVGVRAGSVWPSLTLRSSVDFRSVLDEISRVESPRPGQRPSLSHSCLPSPVCLAQMVSKPDELARLFRGNETPGTSAQLSTLLASHP
jgi:hypothetical protein